MAEFCNSCNDLEDLQPDLLREGVTDEICNSIQNDTGLNPSVRPIHINCPDMTMANNCLIGAFGEGWDEWDPCKYKETLRDFIANLKPMIDLINCNDCGQWLRIHDIERRLDLIEDRLDAIEDRLDAIEDRLDSLEQRVSIIEQQIIDIYNEINTIYQILNALRGVGYSTLPDNRWTCQLFNGWTTESGRIQVRYLETPYEVYIRINSPAGTTRRAYNTDLVGNGVIQAHAASPTPTGSYMWGINFTGASADWQNYSMSDVSESSNGIWNLRDENGSLSAPICWDSNCAIAHNIGGYKLMTIIVGYADGFNTQFGSLQNYWGINGIQSPPAAGVNALTEAILVKPTARAAVAGIEPLTGADVYSVKGATDEETEELRTELINWHNARIEAVIDELKEKQAQIQKEREKMKDYKKQIKKIQKEFKARKKELEELRADAETLETV